MRSGLARGAGGRRGEGGVTRRPGPLGDCGLGLQRVEIFISNHNIASRMAARKSGAHFEGVLRNKIRWDDRAYDAHIFSFVPSDFADQRL